MLRGEAGIGKSSLLARAVTDAETHGMLIVRGMGETELPFGDAMPPGRSGPPASPPRPRP
ncbi:hypothetical protein [Actinomadura sp. SCN-SB]|uniref:hypothetical protein n=1 Tax=Actinomadura sp. SCN-SB TaxID=3373092 RepID=UPI00375178C5